MKIRSGSLHVAAHSVHRWIGILLALLLAPIALSGALLVWHDELDALPNPVRYAVSGTQLLAPEEYLAAVVPALGQDHQLMAVRYPRATGWPVVVLVRQPAEPGQRPRLFNDFVDPPTGRILDKVDFRSSPFGFLHVFHENLTIPDYSGRAIVGWAGVGMLILSLSGIWLWWPRNGALRRGLRWRRSTLTSSNLHHLLGFWISLPRAVVSATGIYLSFPQPARSLMSSIAPMGTSQRPSFAAEIVRERSLVASRALELARALEPEASVAAVFLPSVARERGAQERGGGAAQWRIQLRTGEQDIVTVWVDDRQGVARRQPDPLAGDRAAQWIRWIHEGSRGGPLWQLAVFLTGAFPIIFAVTGVMIWLRGRRRRKAITAPAPVTELQAAE
ncbi:MAG: PepSY domain-containing protein [Hyphomicrobiales bacterium]|nr:PepSY domain-containing protein [Hyphomicrobiales bacterium]